MAIARNHPECPKCGESIRGIHANRPGFVGDTFIRWDFEGHICRLGTLYFIERTDNHHWYSKMGWTLDPLKAKAFKEKSIAEEFLKMDMTIPPRLECIVTEHEFVSKQ